MITYFISYICAINNLKNLIKKIWENIFLKILINYFFIKNYNGLKWKNPKIIY